jgi:hypothetical protein
LPGSPLTHYCHQLANWVWPRLTGSARPGWPRSGFTPPFNWPSLSGSPPPIGSTARPGSIGSIHHNSPGLAQLGLPGQLGHNSARSAWPGLARPLAQSYWVRLIHPLARPGLAWPGLAWVHHQPGLAQRPVNSPQFGLGSGYQRPGLVWSIHHQSGWPGLANSFGHHWVWVWLNWPTPPIGSTTITSLAWPRPGSGYSPATAGLGLVWPGLAQFTPPPPMVNWVWPGLAGSPPPIATLDNTNWVHQFN